MRVEEEKGRSVGQEEEGVEKGEIKGKRLGVLFYSCPIDSSHPSWRLHYCGFIDPKC